MNTYTSKRRLSQQRGMTMIIVMIFLLLLTLLGVSSMSTANMQERMASNTQNQVTTFQAADTAISQVISTGTAFNAAMVSSSSVNASDTIGNVTISTSTSGSGSSVPRGYDLTMFTSNDFSINAVADNSATKAHAENQQQVSIIGPKL